MAAVDDRTTLIVLSDHGFCSFRKAVNLNTWLARNGYMSLKSVRRVRDRNLDDLFGRGPFWPNVQWRQTRAYALGLGDIYVNLKGRERFGVVAPGREYESLRDEIVQKLEGLRDPETGARVILKVSKREEVYHGEYFDQAPDLIVGFNEGYRVSWQTALGGIPSAVIEENRRKWSGDHCSVFPGLIPGIFLSNRAISGDAPHIMDIAPTVLDLFDLPIPHEVDGRPLFRDVKREDMKRET